MSDHKHYLERNKGLKALNEKHIMPKGILCKACELQQHKELGHTDGKIKAAGACIRTSEGPLDLIPFRVGGVYRQHWSGLTSPHQASHLVSG